MFFYYVIFFLFGLAIGSFLNCAVCRIEKDESFLKGRSYCPHCKHTLSYKDLVPLLSFLVLLGKCRYCKKKISFQYPLVEIFTGLLFLSILFFSSNVINAFFFFAIFSFLIIIFIYDLKHFLIPDIALYPALILALIYQLVQVESAFLSVILSAVLSCSFFLSIFLVSRGKWMGFGDVKLAFFMGLFLGYPNILVALFMAFSIGAIISLVIVFLKKKSLKSEVPFGPFLIIGTYIGLFFGETIYFWYINLF